MFPFGAISSLFGGGTNYILWAIIGGGLILVLAIAKNISNSNESIIPPITVAPIP